MKKSFVFDVLFVLLMVGVIACEDEMENVSLSSASVEDWTQASTSFFAELTDPKKDAPKIPEYQFKTTHYLNRPNKPEPSQELIVFEYGDFENFGLINPEEENLELIKLQVLASKLEKAFTEKDEKKLVKFALNDQAFPIDFLKVRIKLIPKDSDLIRVVLKEKPRSKELKINLIS
jgi:hypothetical protein